MEKTNQKEIDWKEISRKIDEIQKAVKLCEYIYIQSQEDWEEAMVSQYGRLNNGYEMEREWKNTDWFVEFHVYADKEFLSRHINDKIFLDYSEETKMLEKFDQDCSVDIFENDNFSDCWLRYYIGIPGEVPLDVVESHVHVNPDIIIGRCMFLQ